MHTLHWCQFSINRQISVSVSLLSVLFQFVVITFNLFCFCYFVCLVLNNEETAMKLSVFLVFVGCCLVIITQRTGGTDCIHEDDSCELYLPSGYRLQFLGGYDGDELNEMCYSYKLHECNHRQGLYNQQVKHEDEDDNIVTVSLEISDLESKDNGYDVLCDYLTKVSLDYNDNNDYGDRYYVDDKHFYYLSKNVNSKAYDDNNNTIISLCFQDRNHHELYSNTISPTQYCISYAEKFCSERCVYVTDICGKQNDTLNFASQTSIIIIFQSQASLTSLVLM